MQRGGPRCKKPFLLSFVRPTCKKAGRHAGLAARDAKTIFASRTANLAMSALLFYCFTISLFYFFTPGTVLPRPMFGVGRPRCKKAFHILPRTTAERSFCFSDGQPCMSALLFYCFTILLFYFFTPRPRCKKNVFASRTANLACRPSYSTVLLI